MTDVPLLPIFSFSHTFNLNAKTFLGVTDQWGTLLIAMQRPYLIGLDKCSTHSWGEVLCCTEKLVITRIIVLKKLMVNIFTEYYAKFLLECPVKCVIGIENPSWVCLTGSILHFARYSLPTTCKHKSKKMPVWLSRERGVILMAKSFSRLQLSGLGFLFGPTLSGISTTLNNPVLVFSLLARGRVQA